MLNEHLSNCLQLITSVNTGCFSESGDFTTLFFFCSATQRRMPLSPFFCQI